MANSDDESMRDSTCSEIDDDVDGLSDSDLVEILEQEVTEDEQVCVLTAQYMMPYVCKEPKRTSNLTGHLWVQEVMEGNPTRFHELFRMEKDIFNRLCYKLSEHGLRHSRCMDIEEMVALFLLIVSHGHRNRTVQERFQHSGETVSRHFHKVLQACISLADEIIKPRDATFSQYDPNIRNDQRYWPFFKDAIGAIDGTHILCIVSMKKKDKYIGRKGYPTQNVMAVCDWDLCFIFVLAGWEGTAHDARIFNTAITTSNMNFPHPPSGKYYLVDVGYPTPRGYLGLYRRQRYHLATFRQQPGFTNNDEAFNYYHSSLRSAIERAFGIWKKRFAILRHMAPYKFKTQVLIVCATMAIHNFIRQNSETDADFVTTTTESVFIDGTDDDTGEASSSNVPSSSTHMNRIRDRIRDQIVHALRS